MLKQVTFSKKTSALKKLQSQDIDIKWVDSDYFYKVNGYTKKNDGKKEIIDLENSIHADVKSIVLNFETTYFPKWIKSIKNYSLCGLDRRLELQSKGLYFLTNEVQPIVRTYVDRLVQSLYRTNFFIKAYSLTKKTNKQVAVIQKAIERGFSSSRAKKSLLDIGTTAILNGVGYARSGFVAPEETARDIIDGGDDNVDISEFLPQFEWVSEFNIFGEPFIPFNEQRFIVYRKIIPMKTALSRCSVYNKYLNDKQKEILVQRPKPVSEKNFDKVRLIKYYEDKIMNEKYYTQDNYYTTTFGNDYCEYIEKRDSDNLIIMINGRIVSDGPNPLHKRTSPFHIVNSTNFPGTWIADGIGTILEGPQKLYDALYNMSFDLMKFQAGPMFLKQPGMGIEGMKEILKYEPFKFVQVTGAGKLETLQMPLPDPSVFKGMTDILNMANLSISPASYSQYQGVSRSATDSQARMEGLKDATVVLVKSMNTMLTEVANVRLNEMKMKMPNKFTIPIFNNQGEVNDWQQITLKDLDGSYLFERDSESIRDMNKMVDRSQLNELGSFIKMFGKDPTDGRWLIDTKKLLKEGLGLFNKADGLVLSDDEYYNKIVASKQIGEKVQKKLSKIQESFGPKPNAQSNIGPIAQSSEGQQIQKPSVNTNYNQDPNAKQIGEPKRQGGLDMAGLLKSMYQ